MSLRIGSLFSGIEGLGKGLMEGLADQGVDAHLEFLVEQDPYCLSVLAEHYPTVPRFTDVRAVDATVLPAVDVLIGGFPCTDVSSAGKRRGLGTQDAPTRGSGLWFEFDRIIGALTPRWVVIENVASGAGRWLPFVRRALGSRGYDSVPLGIAACEVGARHRRERIFVVGRLADPGGHGGHEGADQPRRPDALGSDLARGVAAHPDRLRELQPSGCLEQVRRWADHGAAADPRRTRLANGQRERGDTRALAEKAPERDPGALSPGFGLPPRPWMVRGVHGLPAGLDGAAWRAAGWTPAKVRQARIKALGNTVVPPQARPVGFLLGHLILSELA